MANYDLTYEGSEVQKILDTGDELRDAGYIFRGEATPSTVPGTPTERVAYIGGPGTYTNFGSSITVGAGCICVFKYTGSAWSNQVINTGLSDAISSEATTRSEADTALQNAINSEATTRSEADTALQNAINSEATTRSEADTALQNAINSEATTRSEADTALQNAITAINNNIGNGYVFAGVATPSTSPVTGKVFYLAVQAGTYTNFEDSEEIPLAVTAGINILKNTGTGWVLDQVIAIDDEPTQGSANLVKSGGVLNSIIQNGPAFDLSAYNAQGGTLATYADLSAALTALNALPADFKKGGMSMKYVQTSDKKYVQYRLMADEFTTDVTKWQGVDNEPTADSDNLIKSGGVYDTLFNRIEGNNKLDWSARLLHKYIDNHGVIVDANSFCVSNAITCKKGDIIYFAQYSNKLDKYLTISIEVCEFDSDDTFVKKTTVTYSSYDGEFLPCEITGDNTAYIRINFVPAATATDGVVFINEKLPYEPYIEPTDEPKYVSKDEAEETKEQIIEMISNVEFEKHRQVNQYSPIFVDILTDILCKAGTGFFNLFDTSILNPNSKFDEVSEIDEEVVWHNNAWFKVSGIAGNDYVTFSEAGNADMSDIVISDNWKGAVIQNANGDYVFCLAKYKDENSLYIYPSLTENLTNVEFGQKQSDDLHLTRRGYYAYAYALFNTNIKYCEKNLYIDKYRPTDEVNPFIPYGANYAYVTRMNIEAVTNYVQIGASTVPAHTCLSFGAAINDTMFQNTPFGIKWSKNIKGYKGYVEVYIGGSCAGQTVNTGIQRQSGEEIFIELWLDGVLSQRIEKNTNYVERICIDYENAKEAELRIGANGIHSVDSPFIYIGAVTWWVSEMYFGSNANIFADHSIVQAFDSWGVFDDGASFNKLKEYIDAFTEMNNEMYNLSSGGKTSLYWKHWFSNIIKPKHPSLVISNYGINDYKGPEYAGNVVAPDGTVYPNTNNKGDYVDNMTHCIKMNMNHGFLPVVCSSGLQENGYINEWYQAVIDNLARNVNL